MDNENAQQYGTIEIIAAFCITGMIYLGSFAGPVAAQIMDAFKFEASDYKTINTIPSLMMVVLSLVSGGLTAKFPIKKIVCTAGIFSVVGSLLPIFVTSKAGYIASKVIFGVGHGLTFPMASAIINNLFKGEQKDKLMGIRAGVGALMGAGYTTVAGFAGKHGYKAALACSAIAIPLILFIALKCPNNELYENKKKVEGGEGEKKFTGSSWIIFVSMFLYNMMTMALLSNLSLYMSAEKLADTGIIGTISSMNTYLAFVAGLIFAKVKKVLGRYTTSLAFICVTVAFFLMADNTSLPLFYVAVAINGLGFGLYNPSITLAVAKSAANPKYGALAISAYTSAIGIGQFLSAKAIKFLNDQFFHIAYRPDWHIARWPVLAIAVCSVIYIAVTGGKEGVKKEA